jgi:transcriptional regulator with XRE-family HTH domain
MVFSMTSAAQSADSFGSLLRRWRTTRGKSQLELSMSAGVSSRHLSFVETGRSSPSREMVLTLSEALAVPLRDRNALLNAAGFAPLYQETPLEGAALSEVRHALSHLLESSESPMLIVNRRYDILLANEPALKLVEFFAPGWRGRSNVALLLFEKNGLRPSVTNWGEVAAHVAHRLTSELSVSKSRSKEDEQILAHALRIDEELRHVQVAATRPPAILVPLKFQRDDVEIEMFTTIATLGTPLDITLHELRIETLFPANERARNSLATILKRATEG